MKTVKPKKCKVCKSEFKPFKSIQVVCSHQCAAVLGKEKAAKKEAKEWRERRRKLSEGLETRTQKINKVRKVFQQWVRLRDKNKPCISCGTLTAQQWDAGHYLKAELYTGLIFTENNCFAQCSRCNQHGGGMQAEYRIGLVERIGEERVKALETKKDALRSYTWSDYELANIKQKYTDLIKEFNQNQ